MDTSDEEKRDRDVNRPSSSAGHAPLHVWSSKELMCGAKEVLIEHEGDMYRLSAKAEIKIRQHRTVNAELVC